MQIVLLGEVSARVDGRQVDLGPPRQRCVLAALAVDAGRVVPAERLMGRVWGSGMHDLVRAYAATVAEDLPVDVREAAARRLLEFYTVTAHAAERLLYPQRHPVRLDLPTADVPALPLPDAPAAMAWFDAEHACLIGAQHVAMALGLHSTVWHLAWALNTFHYRRGHRHDRLMVWQNAADAATHLSDPVPRTLAHQYLGHAHADLHHHEEALDHLHQALSLAAQHHEPSCQAQAHNALARAWEQRGDDRRALNHARHALDLYRSLDQPVWEAAALNAVGWYAARLGDYGMARTHCQAALASHRLHHNLTGEAATLDSLGYIDHHSGHHLEAIDHYRQALTLFRGLGNTYEAANTLAATGDPHVALGHTAHARAVWQEALELYEEQGRDDDASRTRQRLDLLRPEDDGPTSR